MARRFLFEGHSPNDAFVSSDVGVTLTQDGVFLQHDGSGHAVFVQTTSAPKPGAKVTASRSLPDLAGSPFIRAVLPGGGLFNIASVVGKNGKTNGGILNQSLKLLNSGIPTPELDQECRRLGLHCDSLGRQNGVTNLVIPLDDDRLIIREESTVTSDCLTAKQLNTVTQMAGEATVVVSSSSKDLALTMAVLAVGNGCRRYAQLTGRAGLEVALLLGKTAHEVIANFSEWCNLGRQTGMTIPDVGECNEWAPAIAHEILQRMQSHGWAGTDAAVCTLGRFGSVVADWVKGRTYHIPIEMIDGTVGVPTPSGAGDCWFGEYITLRETWSKRWHLREPIAATGLRATHRVARSLGLSDHAYDAYFIEM